MFGESRLAAAKRKLWEECALLGGQIREVGTFDVIIGINEGSGISHCVSTVYICRSASGDISLDYQSAAFEWRLPDVWLSIVNHKFLVDAIHLVLNEDEQGSRNQAGREK